MANPKKKKQFNTKKHLAREQREAKQTRIIIAITIVVAVIVLGLVTYGLVNQLIVRPNISVAQVGEKTITVDEFESRVEYARVQLLNQSYQYFMMYQQFSVYGYGSEFLEAAQNYATLLVQPVSFGSDILDEMINDIIIKEEAAARGITVSEEEIDEAIQAAFGFFPEGTYTPSITATIESTPTYSETQLALVTLTNTPTEPPTPTVTPEVSPTPTETIERTETGLEATDSNTGESSTDITENPEETLTPDVSPTITFTPTITPTPTTYTTEIFGEDIGEFNETYKPYNFNIIDLRELFVVELLREKLIQVIAQDLIPVEEEVWARHILVETAEEAQTLLTLLDKGFQFSDIASQHSLDTSNKDIGGDLGWFDKDTMVAEFTEAAFNLEVGGVSEPVETSYGFHIIQVLGKRESQIPETEFEEDKAEVFNDWLTQLRNDRTDIVIYDEWEEYVSDKPEVPQNFLYELYQASQ